MKEHNSSILFPAVLIKYLDGVFRNVRPMGSIPSGRTERFPNTKATVPSALPPVVARAPYRYQALLGQTMQRNPDETTWTMRHHTCQKNLLLQTQQWIGERSQSEIGRYQWMILDPLWTGWCELGEVFEAFYFHTRKHWVECLWDQIRTKELASRWCPWRGRYSGDERLHFPRWCVDA